MRFCCSCCCCCCCCDIGSHDSCQQPRKKLHTSSSQPTIRNLTDRTQHAKARWCGSLHTLRASDNIGGAGGRMSCGPGPIGIWPGGMPGIMPARCAVQRAVHTGTSSTRATVVHDNSNISVLRLPTQACGKQLQHDDLLVFQSKGEQWWVGDV
jgi:hypothetical protein